MADTERYCCNPLGLPHTKQISASCHKLTQTTVDQLRKLTGREFVVGKQKICPTCRKEVNKQLDELQQSNSPMNTSVGSNSDTDTETISRTSATEAVDTSAAAVGVSLLKFRKVSRRDSSGYAKRKVAQLHTAITKQVAAAGALEPKDIEPSPSSSQQQCQKCKDYDILLEELKTKLKTSSSRAEKVQILTLRPESWRTRKTMTEFGVSERMVRTAKELHQKDGVLAMPAKKKGRPLPSTTKELVQSFYQDEEYSRMCPGMKDKVTVRINGVKMEKQKRLLLCNLNELYVQFRNKYPDVKIGITKFCQLRPEWCIRGPLVTNSTF